MGWQSFVRNRMPLLNLPDEVLAALRQGKIAYTKAVAIAKVKDPEQRRDLLEEAIENDLSLTEIKERVNVTNAAVPRETSKPLKSRFHSTYQLLKKSKAWTDPDKQKLLEDLLEQMEALAKE